MATLYLPDARMAVSRFATGKNTENDQVALSLQEWAASFQKVSPGFTLNRVRSFCLCAAMSYPTADKEQLYVAGQWEIILFAWDDIFDCLWEDNLMEDANGAKEINRQMDSVFDYPETSEEQADVPVVAAFRDFWAGYRARSTPTVQQRFRDTAQYYAQAAAALVHNREKRRSPRVEEFVTLRRATSGLEPCFALVEYILEIEVPDKAFHHTVLQELRDAGNDIVAWTNDLYSFNKEQAVGDYQNLVAVVAIDKNLDVQSAIQFVFTMIQSAVDRFLEVKVRVPKFDPETDELVSRYTQGIECCTSGLVSWHFEVDRYFGTKVSELVYSFPVKVLPQEKDALDPGFQLKYNTMPVLTSPEGHEETTSNGPHTASLGPLLQRILKFYDSLYRGVWH